MIKKKLTDKNRITGKYFRLVIPNVNVDKHVKSSELESEKYLKLKRQCADLIESHELKRGLECYSIAIQHHHSGKPHLDILLIYSKKIWIHSKWYDYILKHGDLTRYRTVNSAILKYNLKQDPNPFGTLIADKYMSQHLASHRDGLYKLCISEMLKDPFNFNAIQWLSENGLCGSALKTSWQTVLKLVKLHQSATCKRLIRNMPGILQITPQLIIERLSESQLTLFDSWSGYQTIVDHINQIPRYGFKRPHKSTNLLLVGKPNTGKTALVMKIQNYCSSYPLGTPGGWFPQFKSKTYDILVWDEFNLSIYKYPDLLRLLEGRPMKLPQKGSHVMRNDNQLIIGTTNLSLQQHILWRFTTLKNQKHAFSNLSVRLVEVIIPSHLNLFLLLKLIIPKT